MSMYQLDENRINTSQCALLAAKKALEYQKIDGRIGTRTDLGFLPKSGSILMKSSEAAGREYGISHQTVQYGIYVLKKGIPELADMVRDGHLAIYIAAKIARILTPEEQRQVIHFPKKKLSEFINARENMIRRIE